ncbi:unnamed protein product, partial [Brenthis ino]
MKDSSSFVPPRSDPPPYSGPPGQNFSPHPGYVTMTQPQMSGVHVVTHPPTIIQGPTIVPVVMGNPLGSDPSRAYCRSCNMHVITNIRRTPSMRTHLLAAFLCALALWPCACIPYCVDSCNNADHYCTNCNAYLGSHSS